MSSPRLAAQARAWLGTWAYAAPCDFVPRPTGGALFDLVLAEQAEILPCGAMRLTPAGVAQLWRDDCVPAACGRRSAA